MEYSAALSSYLGHVVALPMWQHQVTLAMLLPCLCGIIALPLQHYQVALVVLLPHLHGGIPPPCGIVVVSWLHYCCASTTLSRHLDGITTTPLWHYHHILAAYLSHFCYCLILATLLWHIGSGVGLPLDWLMTLTTVALPRWHK